MGRREVKKAKQELGLFNVEMLINKIQTTSRRLRKSVPVIIWFVRTFYRDSQVFCLFRS